VVEEKGFDHLVIKNENQVYLNQNENYQLEEQQLL
jgi:hypothetical protein